MDMRSVTGFDWDDANWTKCQKHGVSIAEIEAVFEHVSRTGPDPAHSLVEDRFIAIRFEGVPRPIFVVFTLRDVDGKQLIRPISARYMRQKELNRHA